jgi:hypothetical protein
MTAHVKEGNRFQGLNINPSLYADAPMFAKPVKALCFPEITKKQPQDHFLIFLAKVLNSLEMDSLRVSTSPACSARNLRGMSTFNIRQISSIDGTLPLQRISPSRINAGIERTPYLAISRQFSTFSTSASIPTEAITELTRVASRVLSEPAVPKILICIIKYQLFSVAQHSRGKKKEPRYSINDDW